MNGKCDTEIQDERGRWVRCGQPAEWWWPALHWEVCDEHARYGDAKRAGQLVHGIVSLTEKPGRVR